jgi:tRNA-specific 2-thiouridylase
MSGGVDSTAAAALLVRSGQPALGVTIRMWDCAGFAGRPAGSGVCCSPRDAADAARACRQLGIEHFLVNLTEEFSRLVVEPFCREYAAGRTPNPCVRCNRLIKFGELAGRVRTLGCSALATGHYARLQHLPDGSIHLLRGDSPDRDQSYFLSALTQEQLAFTQFPVGDMDKPAIRELVAALGLPAAAKPASQEFCFAPDGAYDRVLQRYAPEALEPGPLLDTSGRKLGVHAGIGRYTVGQRRGLGVATGEPLYVLAILPAERAVVVGPEAGLMAWGLQAQGMNWIGEAPAHGTACTARVRHGGREVPATVTPLQGEGARVHFANPVRAVAPGQQVALYLGRRVLGGGVIASSIGEKTP